MEAECFVAVAANRTLASVGATGGWQEKGTGQLAFPRAQGQARNIRPLTSSFSPHKSATMARAFSKRSQLF